jgi:hypothetical protein
MSRNTIYVLIYHRHKPLDNKIGSVVSNCTSAWGISNKLRYKICNPQIIRCVNWKHVTLASEVTTDLCTRLISLQGKCQYSK